MVTSLANFSTPTMAAFTGLLGSEGAFYAGQSTTDVHFTDAGNAGPPIKHRLRVVCVVPGVSFAFPESTMGAGGAWIHNPYLWPLMEYMDHGVGMGAGPAVRLHPIGFVYQNQPFIGYITLWSHRTTFRWLLPPGDIRYYQHYRRTRHDFGSTPAMIPGRAPKIFRTLTNATHLFASNPQRRLDSECRNIYHSQANRDPIKRPRQRSSLRRKPNEPGAGPWNLSKPSNRPTFVNKPTTAKLQSSLALLNQNSRTLQPASRRCVDPPHHTTVRLGRVRHRSAWTLLITPIHDHTALVKARAMPSHWRIQRGGAQVLHHEDLNDVPYNQHHDRGVPGRCGDPALPTRQPIRDDIASFEHRAFTRRGILAAEVFFTKI
ncbi:hypothetical protein D9611_009933 [Ephemerocybe angulata]|uniref:Uncharacterized protein n=1 Tax=Ephemerocybe angulata TaxID=980116 RepID=A0A8H5C4A8_9AGAR|nr:hypothetical protein D9611_009933 [Tulosesus angulatus]